MNAITPIAYRPTDTARALGISEALVYELIANGDLPARKLGRATLILRADIDTYLSSLPLTASAARAPMKAAQ